MKERIYNSMPKIGEVKGKYTIDLTDPITKKIKHRVEKENHVFRESLLCPGQAAYGWIDFMANYSYLALTNNVTPVDEDFPYLPGQIIGYGKPSTAGSGTLRGAYNSANQVMGSRSLTSIRWKFQYDFTTAQANGLIGTLGVTRQYGTGSFYPYEGYYAKSATNQTYRQYTCDGRYAYSCSTAGVITKYDYLANTSSTIDISAIVGTLAADAKTVGYAGSTGKFYVYVYNATAANRKVYEFSNSTFSTLENTYAVSNIGLTYLRANRPAFYVYNGVMYTPGVYEATTGSTKIGRANFTTNTVLSEVTVTVNSVITSEDPYCNYINMYSGATVGQGVFFVVGGFYNGNSNTSQGVIYNMAEDTIAPMHYHLSYYANETYGGTGLIAHPLYAHKVFFASEAPMRTNCAISQCVLDTPITKTSANGLTATYELEVFWA